jgi:hypothetical protein
MTQSEEKSEKGWREKTKVIRMEKKRGRKLETKKWNINKWMNKNSKEKNLSEETYGGEELRRRII